MTEWIHVKKETPSIDEGSVLCWSVKFGDEKRSNSSHSIILWWNGKFWEDDSGRNYENNPNYHSITHWMKLPNPPHNNH